MVTFFDIYKLHGRASDIERYKKGGYKKCKFCGRDSNDVTFYFKPHIIPQLFGRNNYSSNFECDECNQYFQKLETDTATLIQHYHSFLRIPTSNKVPSFQSRRGNTNRTKITQSKEYGGPRIELGKNVTDIVYNEKENTADIYFRLQRFRPYSVYRILLKLGLSILGNPTLDKNPHFLEILNSENPNNDFIQTYELIRYRLDSKFFSTPQAILYQAIRTKYEGYLFPEFMLVLFFANQMFQFFLPFSEKNYQAYSGDKSEIMSPLFPAQIYNNFNHLNFQKLDLSLNEKIELTDSVQLKYSHIDKNVTN